MLLSSSTSAARALLALLAFGVAAFFLFCAISELSERQLLAELDRRWGSFDEVLERFPARSEPNAAALELERIGESLGFSVVPHWRRKPVRMGPWDDRGAADYISTEETRDPLERPQALPPELKALIEDNGALLARVLHLETPRWERELETFDADGVPNLLGMLRLHRLLNVWALSELRKGKGDKVLEISETMWRLSSALRDEPHLIARVITIAMERSQLRLLARLEEVPSRWVKRSKTMKHEVALENVMRFEVWRIARDDLEPSGVFAFPVLSTLAKPYLKLCQLDAASAATLMIEDELARERTCRVDPHPQELDAAYWFSWWNAHDESLFLFSPRHGFVRAKRLELEAELATLWFTREAFSVDAQVPSSACKDCSWVFAREEHGGRALTLEGEVDFEGLPGSPLLSRMTERGTLALR